MRTAGRDDRLWIDLRGRDLGGLTSGGGGTRWRASTQPSTIYVPPLLDEETSQGLELVKWCQGERLGVVEHVVVGTDEIPSPVARLRIYDLLDLLVDDDWARLGRVPPASIFAWPLVPGLTDVESRVVSGLGRLSECGARAVIPIVPDLSPGGRRRLADRCGDAVFETVFHGGRADPRDFAASCRKVGLDFLPQRPATPVDSPVSRHFERRLAAELSLIADLLIDREDSESRAQSFYRAARWLETATYDVRSLVRDGNLSIVPWMTAEIRTVTEELARGGQRSSLLDHLARED